MILPVFLMIVILFCIACVLFFIFYLLLPSLSAQKVNTSDALFSRDEFTTRNVDTDDENLSKKAVILCSAEREKPAVYNRYHGIADCSYYTSLYDDDNSCMHGCIGLGSCAKVCPEGAISIRNGIAVISVACNGCGKCVSMCPRNLIKMVDRKDNQLKKCNACNNPDWGTDNQCDKYGTEQALPVYVPKGFDFWTKLYKTFRK